MSIFGGATSEGLEETQDRIGGFSAHETDAYTGPIKLAYAGKSDGGANFVHIEVETGNGQTYREDIYWSNRKGENFYLNKNDQTKKIPLPGFVTLNDICLVTTEKPLSMQETEEKMVNIYDYDQKKEVPKSVPVLIGLLGKEVTLGILKQIENKSVKQGNEYVPTAETRETNTIDKVFHAPTKRTVNEAKEGKETAEFFEAWVKRNKGVTRDKRTLKDGQGGTAGRPTAAGAPPQAAGGGERKSLFGS